MGRNRARDGNFSALRCPKNMDDYLTFLLQRKWIRHVPKTKFEKTSLERWQKSWFMKNIQAMERFHCLWGFSSFLWLTCSTFGHLKVYQTCPQNCTIVLYDGPNINFFPWCIISETLIQQTHHFSGPIFFTSRVCSEGIESPSLNVPQDFFAMFDTIQNIQQQKQVVETTSRNTKTSPCKQAVCWGTVTAGIDSHHCKKPIHSSQSQKNHRCGVVIIGKYSSFRRHKNDLSSRD